MNNPLLFQSLSRLTKPAVFISLGIGMYLHITRLFIGSELLIQHIYTATFDSLLTIPILFVVITFIPAWKRMVFKNKFDKIVVALTGVYFLLSLPLHAQTWYTESTDYVLMFPLWYSGIFLAFTMLLMFVWSRVKVE